MRFSQTRHSWVLATALMAFLPLLAQGPKKEQTTTRHRDDGNYNYVFLFDVSGSMKEPGKLGLARSSTRRYLAEHLFASPEIFVEGRPASVYSFTVKSQREFTGPLRHAAIQNMLLDALPITRGDTDLEEMLRTAEADHAQNSRNGMTLAWILTDNANDPVGVGPDEVNTRRFYARMFNEDTSAQRMYFFPLKDFKLVLYLLVFAPDSSLQGIDIDHFEDQLAGFAQALGAPKIRAKPVGGERPLELAGLTSSDEGVMAAMIGSGPNSFLQVTGLKEGQPLSARFKLHVRSRFDEWRVDDANVEVVSLEGLQSSEFPNIGGRMPVQFDPRNVTVDPRSQTSKIYTLELGQARDMLPKAPFFTMAAFNPDAHGVITGKLIIKIGNPKLTLKIFNDQATTNAIHSVFHLDDIEYFVPKSTAGREMRLDLAIPVQFEVGYNPLWRWVSVGVLLFVLAVGSIWILTHRGKSLVCRLIGYQEDTFTLTPAAVFPIAPAGTRIAELRKSHSGIVCKPMPGVMVNGKPNLARVANGSLIQLIREDLSYSYRLEVVSNHRSAPQEEEPTQSGGFY